MGKWVWQNSRWDELNASEILQSMDSELSHSCTNESTKPPWSGRGFVASNGNIWYELQVLTNNLGCSPLPVTVRIQDDLWTFTSFLAFKQFRITAWCPSPFFPWDFCFPLFPPQKNPRRSNESETLFPPYSSFRARGRWEERLKGILGKKLGENNNTLSKM